MLTVTDYARKLLHEHDCVVIPELGGFLAHFSHAYFNPQNATYHAPHKRVAFNEALKLDDGLLVHYITVNEQVTREVAQGKVRQFVEDVRQGIKDNGEYMIEGVGVLSENHESRLTFDPVALTNFYADGYGFETISVENLHTSQTTEEVSQEEVWSMAQPEADESFVYEMPRQRNRSVWYAAAGIALVGVAVWGISAQSSVQWQSSDLNPANVVSTIQSYFSKPETTTVAPKPAVTKAPTLVAAPTKPLAVAPLRTAAKPATNVVEAPKVVAPKPVVQKTGPIVERLLTNDATVNCYVVGGSFSKLENAQNLELKLRNAGYQNAHIMNPDAVAGELIKVAVIGLDDYNKAQAQLKYINKLTGTKSCVVKK